MTTENIEEWLSCLVSNQHTKCPSCPFNPVPGVLWIYGCGKGQEDLVKAVRERLDIIKDVKGNV